MLDVALFDDLSPVTPPTAEPKRRGRPPKVRPPKPIPLGPPTLTDAQMAAVIARGTMPAREAARHLGISPDSVRRLAERGRLLPCKFDGIRVSLVYRASVEALVYETFARRTFGFAEAQSPVEAAEHYRDAAYAYVLGDHRAA